jgi:hypothetical protein
MMGWGEEARMEMMMERENEDKAGMMGWTSPGFSKFTVV